MPNSPNLVTVCLHEFRGSWKVAWNFENKLHVLPSSSKYLVRIGVSTPKDLLRKPLACPNTFSLDIWRMLEDVGYIYITNLHQDIDPPCNFSTFFWVLFSTCTKSRGGLILKAEYCRSGKTSCQAMDVETPKFGRFQFRLQPVATDLNGSHIWKNIKILQQLEKKRLLCPRTVPYKIWWTFFFPVFDQWCVVEKVLLRLFWGVCPLGSLVGS